MSSQTKITYSPSANASVILPGTETLISTIANQAGVKSLQISSTSRSIEKQCQVMVDNANSPRQGITGAYALYKKGGVLAGVLDIFSAAKFSNKKLDGTSAGLSRKYAMDQAQDGSIQSYKIDSLSKADRSKIIQMATEYLQQNRGATGPHTRDYLEWQVLDIAPSSIYPQKMAGRFMAMLSQATKSASEVQEETIVFKYIKPGNGEPAHHIEIKSVVSQTYSETALTAIPATGPFTLGDNLVQQSQWQAPFALDAVAASGEQS